MPLLSPLATSTLLLALALVPAIASAESDTSCPNQVYQEPVPFGLTDPMVRDGWIAFQDWDREISNVRLVDAAGSEFPANLVFGDDTFSSYDLYQPNEALEPGAYVLKLIHEAYCFEPRELSFPVQVEGFAEPVVVAPTIKSVKATISTELDIDVELEEPPPDLGAVWTLVDADFADETTTFVDHLAAPGELGRFSLDRIVDGMDVDEVCVRATFYNEAGTPSPTTELCTMDIEHVTRERGPLACSVGGGSSSGLGLAMLLGLLGWRRRRPCLP